MRRRRRARERRPAISRSISRARRSSNDMSSRSRRAICSRKGACVPGRRTPATRLRASAAGGAQALVVIAGGRAAGIIVREAIDSGLYDRFAFGDGAKRLDLVRSIGGACTAPGRRRPPTAPRRRRGRRPMSPSTGRCRFWPARPPSRRNSAITSPEVSCRPIAINCGRSRGTVGSWSSSHRDLRAGRTDRFAVNGTGAVRRGTIS